MSVRITDGGNPSYDDYGSLVGPLINGIDFYIDFFDRPRLFLESVIKRNIDWLQFGPKISVIQFSGDRFLSYNFNMNFFSDGIYLREGDSFGVRIRDNLSSLTSHEMGVRGYFRRLDFNL